jgi:hypothetical protein
MYKINYWHQYTIDAVQSFTFLTKTIENFKNILCLLCLYVFNIFFALLDGWTVTKKVLTMAFHIVQYVP